MNSRWRRMKKNVPERTAGIRASDLAATRRHETRDPLIRGLEKEKERDPHDPRAITPMPHNAGTMWRSRELPAARSSPSIYAHLACT